MTTTIDASLKAATDAPREKHKKPAWVYGSLVDDEDLVNIMYYGEPGSGKTSSLASLARLGRIIYIEAESGLKKAPLVRLGIPIKNIQLVRDTASEQQITFGKLEALHDRLRLELARDPAAIVGVVWDSVTEIQKKLLRIVADKRIDRFADKGTEVETHKMVVEDYGINTEQMRDLIRMYRDLPCHFGVAGLEVRDEDDDGAITYRPHLTPKLAADLTGYVDLVCYTTDRMVGGQRYYVGMFKRGGKYQAKDRFGILPEVLVDPWYDRVVAYIKGELTEDDDKKQQAWLTARAAATAKRKSA